MHVLQGAVGVVCSGVHTQQLHHLGVPQGRHVFGFDQAFNERALNLVAQDHVRRVGHFIGINADETGFDAG